MGRLRISSNKLSIFFAAAEASVVAGGCSSVGVARVDVSGRTPNNFDRGLVVPNERTSVELNVSTIGERALVFLDLGNSRGEGGDTRTDRTLGGFFLVGRDSQGRTDSPDTAGDGERGASSSEPPKRSNSGDMATSNIASYRSFECDPTMASRNGMCLICRGKLLYNECAVSLPDCRSRWPAAKCRS